MRTPFLVISSNNDKRWWITEIGHGDRNPADFGALGEAAFAAAGERHLAQKQQWRIQQCAHSIDGGADCTYWIGTYTYIGGADCAALAAVEAPWSDNDIH
jgi:hypothetical protein